MSARVLCIWCNHSDDLLGKKLSPSLPITLTGMVRKLSAPPPLVGQWPPPLRQEFCALLQALSLRDGRAALLRIGCRVTQAYQALWHCYGEILTAAQPPPGYWFLRGHRPKSTTPWLSFLSPSSPPNWQPPPGQLGWMPTTASPAVIALVPWWTYNLNAIARLSAQQGELLRTFCLLASPVIFVSSFLLIGVFCLLVLMR